MLQCTSHLPVDTVDICKEKPYDEGKKRGYIWVFFLGFFVWFLRDARENPLR
jgi:hypothetical protein